jgi:hypothetical protein
MSISPRPSTPPTTAEIPPQPERLRLAHFFLWMTLTAVVVALRRPTPSPLSGQLAVYQEAFSLWDSMLFSLGIAALLVAVARFVRNGAGCATQPGHWLLFVIGFRGLSNIAQHVIPISELNAAALLCAQLAATILTAETFVLAAYCSRQPWRSVFWLGAVRDLGMIVVGCFLPNRSLWMMILLWTASYGLLLALLLIALYDGWRGTRRDTIHWIGVTASIIYGGQQLFEEAIIDWLLGT